jgi:hypothetical protein
MGREMSHPETSTAIFHQLLFLALLNLFLGFFASSFEESY